nr:LLM class flavin-dependent oxidoreductase [Cellulosimicrobium sp. MM]
MLADKAAGVWADPAKIHGPAHVGTHFSVHGALTTPRSPQARPLIVQAGSSEDGKDLASRYAEAVFTAHQTLADAQAFYSDLKARAAAVGRDPDTVKILPGNRPRHRLHGGGGARAGARARRAHRPRVRARPACEDAAPRARGPAARPRAARRPAHRGRDRGGQEPVHAHRRARAARAAHGAPAHRAARRRAGHRTFAGTPEQVADALQDWYDAEAADGFNIMPAVLPSGLEQFVEHVLPVLRERGLFRTEYEGRTLREHYGLERPANRYTDAAPTGTSSDGGARVVEGAFA